MEGEKKKAFGICIGIKPLLSKWFSSGSDCVAQPVVGVAVGVHVGINNWITRAQ